MTGRIGVYSLTSTALTKIDEIEVGMPIDNVSIDAKGDVIAGAFPDALKLIEEVKNAAGVLLPSTVWQIRKVNSERDRNGKGNGKGKGSDTVNYRVWKALEDSEGKRCCRVGRRLRYTMLKRGGSFLEVSYLNK